MNSLYAWMRCIVAAALAAGAALQAAGADLPQTRLINRNALAIDAGTQTLYAVDQAHDRVWAVDCVSGSARAIPVGHEPDALAIDTHTHRVYVVNAGGGAVSVLDHGSVVANIPTDTHPYAIALDSSLGLAFVSNTFSNQLTRIDLRTNRSTQLPLGSKDVLAVDELHHQLVMFGYESPVIEVLDERTGAVATQHAAPHLWGLAVDPASGTIYVPEIGSNALYTSGRSALPTGALPDAVELDPVRHRIFVANYGADTVSMFDATRGTLLKTIATGKRPQALAVDVKRGLVYVADTHSDSVTVIDESAGDVRATLAGGVNPYALVLDAATGAVFAATYGAQPYFVVRNHALLTTKGATLP